MTALPNWGSLTKSTTDSSTIDDAIAAAVDAHEADASAHLGAGASLAAHKAYEVIDHPAGSVVGDKFQRTHSVNIDYNGQGGILKYGNATFDMGGVTVYTTAVANNVSTIYGVPSGYSGVDWAKAMYIRHIAKVSSTSNMLALLGIGCDDLGDGYSGFGFKIEDGSLYAYHAEDTGSGAVFTTTAITGYTLTDFHTYEAVYDPDAGTLTFFVDGVQEAQFTSGLPTSSSDENLLIEIKTKNTTAKYLYATNFFFTQDY